MSAAGAESDLEDSDGERVIGSGQPHPAHVHGEWRESEDKSRCQAIRTSSETLLLGLVNRLKKERDAQAFIDLYERVHALFEVRILRGSAPVRKLFGEHATFSHEVRTGTLPPPATDDEVTEDAKEDDARGAQDLIDFVHGIAIKSNFQVLSQDVFEFAIQAEFECSIDQKMDASLLDSSFFSHFYESDRFAEDFAGSADLCKHVLVYHRGVGSASKSGLFAVEKFDLILEWVARFFLSILLSPMSLARYFGLFGSSKPATEGDGTYTDEEIQIKTAEEPPADTPTAGDAAPPKNEKHETDGWVDQLEKQRVSLEKVLWNNPLRFFTPIDLREPTFKEVMIVYRTEEEYETAFAERRHPQIQIALFRDIPIADFETILPAQKPLTRAFDIVKLFVVFVGVITYMVRTVEEQLEVDDKTIEDIIEDLIPALIGLVGYVSKILLSWQKMQATYKATIIKFLQTYSLAKQQAVLPLLLNEMLAQEFKETILAYFFLWQSPNNTPELLDDETEHHLHTFHGETIDFDVRDALIKLKQLGIIQYKEPLTDTSELTYMPISKAVRHLTDAVFLHMRTRERECPYCAAGFCSSEAGHS